MTPRTARADIRPVTEPVQLALIEQPATPKLTPRQQHVHDAIVAAGFDGLHTDEVGAIAHEHSGKHLRDARCMYCGQAGQEVGRTLRDKKLIRQRRRQHPAGFGTELVWVHTDARETRDAAPTSVPYNTFPDGY